MLIYLLSGCALTLDKIIPEKESNQTISFNVYFEAYYSTSLKDFFEEKLEKSFTLSDLDEITVKLKVNDSDIFTFNLKGKNNNVTPPIVIEKSKDAMVKYDIEVTYTLKRDLIDSTEVVLKDTDLIDDLNLLDFQELNLVFFIHDESGTPTLKPKILYEDKKVIKEGIVEDGKIYYVESNNDFYSILKNDKVNEIYVDADSDFSNIYVFPSE